MDAITEQHILIKYKDERGMPENWKGVGMYHFSEIINKIPWSSFSWETDSISATPKNPCFYVTKKNNYIIHNRSPLILLGGSWIHFTHTHMIYLTSKLRSTILSLKFRLFVHIYSRSVPATFPDHVFFNYLITLIIWRKI